MSVGHLYMFFDWSLPLPTPLSPSLLPSGSCQSIPCFHDSGSILRVSLFCSLDSSFKCSFKSWKGPVGITSCKTQLGCHHFWERLFWPPDGLSDACCSVLAYWSFLWCRTFRVTALLLMFSFHFQYLNFSRARTEFYSPLKSSIVSSIDTHILHIGVHKRITISVRMNEHVVEYIYKYDIKFSYEVFIR